MNPRSKDKLCQMWMAESSANHSKYSGISLLRFGQGTAISYPLIRSLCVHSTGKHEPRFLRIFKMVSAYSPPPASLKCLGCFQTCFTEVIRSTRTTWKRKCKDDTLRRVLSPQPSNIPPFSNIRTHTPPKITTTSIYPPPLLPLRDLAHLRKPPHHSRKLSCQHAPNQRFRISPCGKGTRGINAP